MGHHVGHDTSSNLLHPVVRVGEELDENVQDPVLEVELAYVLLDGDVPQGAKLLLNVFLQLPQLPVFAAGGLKDFENQEKDFFET